MGYIDSKRARSSSLGLNERKTRLRRGGGRKSEHSKGGGLEGGRRRDGGGWKKRGETTPWSKTGLVKKKEKNEQKKGEG